MNERHWLYRFVTHPVLGVCVAIWVSTIIAVTAIFFTAGEGIANAVSFYGTAGGLLYGSAGVIWYEVMAG